MPQISPLNWVLIPLFFFCFFFMMMVGVWWVFKSCFEFFFYLYSDEKEDVKMMIWKW
uniref:ATP synthase F0 subunit 8 n=1 Tax=Paranemertes cf. peregrina SCS-2010 TaxID=743461 RepID=E7C1A7_9BILA|nr:ATP synthase F0 subunit 8 [Paranemertes cf. peregrina SCS-2010]ADD62167.1 ATP synthase F0 subunit 8 [Paranemertes cf. peregrina SCS-2010]